MKVLLLGYSSIARRRIIPALKRLPNVSPIIEVCSQDLSKRFYVPHDEALRFVFSSYEDAVTASDADLVYISTHNHLHYKLAKLSLESHKHVICDKPCTCTAVQSFTLLDIAAAYGKGISEATVYLYHTQLSRLKSFFETRNENAIYVHAEFTIPCLSDDNFRYMKRLGGGAILDMGVYAMTIGKLFFDANPVATRCFVSSHATYDVETSFCIIQDFAQGRLFTGMFGFDMAYSNKVEFDTGITKGRLERVFSSEPKSSGILQLNTGSNVQESPVDLGSCDAFEAYLKQILHEFARGDYSHSREKLYESATMFQVLQSEAARNV